MTLYSRGLGEIDAVDTGISHLLYTVPVGGGPAIVRSVSLYAGAAGAQPAVYITRSGINVVVAILPAPATGATGISVDCYQPLEIGDEITALNFGSSAEWMAGVGGYQFATP